MSGSKAAPATHSQPSRKGKKAWRKNVDITAVQGGLEEAREELIQGGIIAEKPSEDLFVLDTAGSEQIKEKHLKGSKPLRADQIIAERASAISAVDSRKRKNTEIAPRDKSKRLRKSYASQQEVQRLKAAVNQNAADGVVAATESADHDPWAVVPKVQDPRFSFLEEKEAVHEPTTLKRAPISLSASGKPFAAVRRPDAGKSYNPDFEAWQSVVTKAGDKEVDAERKRRIAAAAEEEATARALAEAARPDVSESEHESAWESEWEGLRSDGEAMTTNKRPERKTPTQRNKIKRRKQKESQERHELRSRQREERHRLAKDGHEGGNPRSLIPAVRPDESDAESGEEEVLRRRPLGKNFIPEAPLEVVLADELQDSLRALRPEGNLLKDRYRNLLVNGKVEARKTMQHKKPKREVTEKWSYKDWTLR